MRRSFRAIDAIAFGLRYGITGLPTALRLGWASVLLFLAALYVLASQVGDIGPFLSPLAELLGGLERLESGYPQSDRAVEGRLLFIALISLAYILFIPAVTGLIRESAGVLPRRGFLPIFGRPELYLIAAVLVVILIAVLVYAVVGIGAVALIAAWASVWGAAEEPGAVIVILGVLTSIGLVFGLIWFFVRITLVPIHAAVTERLAIKEGFALTRGSFWKLLGALIVFSVVLALMELGVDLSLLALDSMGFVLVGGLLFGAITLYATVAQCGFYGRIFADLYGRPGADRAASEVAEDAEEPLVADEADPAGSELGPQPAYHAPMMRRIGDPAPNPAHRLKAEERPPALAAEPRAQSEPEARGSSIAFLRSRFRG